MQLKICVAQNTDIASWLRLAEDVAPLFGPMPNFEAVLVRKIKQQQAYCVKAEMGSADLRGGVLIGGNGLQHAIRWLAVFPEFRKLGIGKMLVEAALSCVPSGSTVHVDTFVKGSLGAEAAKRLYESCGFMPSEIWREGDVVRQRYVRLS